MSASESSAASAVVDPVGFEEAAQRIRDYDAAIVLWEDQGERLLAPTVRALFETRESHVALFVGPEGGLSAEEVALLEAAGAVTVTLGPSILRTETAAVVGTAIAVSGGYEMDALRDD